MTSGSEEGRMSGIVVSVQGDEMRRTEGGNLWMRHDHVRSEGRECVFLAAFVAGSPVIQPRQEDSRSDSQVTLQIRHKMTRR
jgi:hypothetical protein